MSSIFWDIISCSLLKVNQGFGGICDLHFHGLKMEATCSSKTSVDFQRTTWCHIWEDRTLHNHSYESLKSYTLSNYFRLHKLYNVPLKMFFFPVTNSFKFTYISNTQGYETVENRTHVDITFFIQNELRNHPLKLWQSHRTHCVVKSPFNYQSLGQWLFIQ
jgi:hypothetical protein